MTTPNRSVKHPITGPWAWRDYLPTSMDEWLALRERALELEPEGIDISRFSGWALAEMERRPSELSGKTLAKYRRLLHELAGDLEPTGPAAGRRGRGDKGLTELKLAAAGAAGSASALAAMSAGAGPLLTVLAFLAPVIPADESYVELPELAAAA